MMLKISGGIIICMSAFVIGMKMSSSLEKRSDILNELEKSLVLLKGEIKYSSASLPESIQSVSNRTSNEVMRFYKNLSEQIENNKEIALAGLWEKECNITLKTEEIKQEDLELFIDLGKQLGHLDVDMQIKNIELCISRLKERQAEAYEDIKMKSKLYRTLGISGGALLTLLLL